MSTQYVDLPAYGDPHWQAPVVLTSQLPLNGNQIGDVRLAEDTNTIYVWNGTAWIAVATPGAAIAIDGLIGDVTATGPGVVPATVNFVGGQSAASIAAATVLVETPHSGNVVLASPADGSSGVATFRSLVGADFTGTFTSGSVIFAGSTGGLSQDNANFFWNDATFNLGLSTNTPASNAFVDGVNTSLSAKRLQLTGYGTGSTVGYRGRFANGSLGTPTAATSGQNLTFFSGQGYGTTGFPAASTGAINIVANETFTDTSMATNIAFNVTPTTSVTSATVLTLSSATTTTAALTFSNGFNATVTAGTGATNGDNMTLSAGPATSGNGGNTNVNGGAAGTTAGNQGGAVTVAGAAGTSTGSGGNAGGVTINGGNAGGDDTVNRTAGGITMNAGNSKGSSNGGSILQNGGNGSIGVGGAAGDGGHITLSPGNGGAGTVSSGNGGASNINGATGGAGANGGNGGAVVLNAGNGGAGSSTGGTGGAVTIGSGTAGATAGAAGGLISLTAGQGSATGSGGAGGKININAANARGDSTVNRAGGDVNLNAGNSVGSSAGGAVSITSGVGGIGTGTAGAAGGAITITPGNGGVGSATGGVGGELELEGGQGGASGTPGAGGPISFRTSTTSGAQTRRGTVTAAGNWGFGNNATPTYLVDVLGGNVGVATAGDGYRTKEGANAKQGTATLSAGTATVANTSVTATSRIFLTAQSLGTIAVPAALAITARSAGTSFTITSSAITDTSVVAYEIFEPY